MDGRPTDGFFAALVGSAGAVATLPRRLHSIAACAI